MLVGVAGVFLFVSNDDDDDEGRKKTMVAHSRFATLSGLAKTQNHKRDSGDAGQRARLQSDEAIFLGSFRDTRPRKRRLSIFATTAKCTCVVLALLGLRNQPLWLPVTLLLQRSVLVIDP